MKHDIGRTIATLATGEVASLWGRRDWILTCVEGTLWVTETGCLVDRFLEAGDHHAFTCAVHVVVEALEPSRWVVTRPER